MAVSTTEVYRAALDEHDEDFREEIDMGHLPLDPAGVQFVRDRNQSKALNSTSGPLVIIAGSGMANGGRVVHHLFHRLRDPNTVVLFTGFQAEGTLGRRLIEGEPEVRIFGQEVPVHATVDTLNGLSAHADQSEMLRWLSYLKTPPKKTFIVHGEPPAQEALQAKIAEELGWDTQIAKDSTTYVLD
jgi:metallo-beta-lactamase family protein